MPTTLFGDCWQKLSIAAINLTDHNIKHHEPNIWVHDLKHLALFPDGVKWLNNFPFVELRKAEWEDLYKFWKEVPHVHSQLGGFIAILMTMCRHMHELLGLLRFFDADRLQSIHIVCLYFILLIETSLILADMSVEIDCKINEVMPNSVKQWADCLSLENKQIPDFWHTLLGPTGPFRAHVRSYIKKALPDLVHCNQKGRTLRN